MEPGANIDESWAVSEEPGAGEICSNVPLCSLVALIYPQY